MSDQRCLVNAWALRRIFGGWFNGSKKIYTGFLFFCRQIMYGRTGACLLVWIVMFSALLHIMFLHKVDRATP